MTDSPIRFPGLFGDWAFTASSKAINIGHGIYWYGIIIACGLLLAVAISAGLGTGIFNTIDGVIGTGNGIQIFPAEYGALVLTLPIGGFITLGCLIALMQYAVRETAEKKEAKEKALAAQEKEAA